ncbi:M81 family metallopeptidase [Streptomyces sp. ME19-01-6]|uniref:M81 family metallopeptidase n=1 Tax=Streptomyces sp. ME19-01-6 TaxID=3028686 RepID=UPI0029BC125F|nr:M81 family metallopeptidase [Streptomyces sp. ME19-01-6]MDX3229540.1 M81 family metallopeptidase [Streptomyces sp. ME19-01-6]
MSTPSPVGRRPRIGIGGVSAPSSTFSPHRTRYDDFRVLRGVELRDCCFWARPDGELSGLVEWVPLLHADAPPGGPVEPEAYRRLKTELVDRARQAGPLDGLVYDIHGAMSVVGLDDAEADLTDAVREALGPGALISAAMDPHGNVSRRLAGRLDLITAHRLAPRQDAGQTRERAARKLVERLVAGKGRPHLAWVQVPVLLPGERTSPRLEPATSLYGRLGSIEELDGIVDAAVWAGCPWADEPRCKAAVVVTGDDPVLAVEQARSLAKEYWDLRRDFVFAAPAGDADTCIQAAVASAARPFLISDSGDNPAAGGTGNLPYMLRRLLANEDLATGRATALHPGITDPAAVARCFAAGVGATVRLSVGGTYGPRAAGHGAPYDPDEPYEFTGDVVALREADEVGGDVAAVRRGGVTAVLVSRRKPFRTRADFGELDPRAYDLLVVKAGCPEPELYDLAADWRLALTPGGVDQDLPRLGHHRVDRPLFPFDPDMPAPDLTPELL